MVKVNFNEGLITRMTVKFFVCMASAAAGTSLHLWVPQPRHWEESRTRQGTSNFGSPQQTGLCTKLLTKQNRTSCVSHMIVALLLMAFLIQKAKASAFLAAMSQGPFGL